MGEGESTPTCSQEVNERHHNKLLTDYKSGKWSLSSMSSLMEETYKERSKCLKANLPVSEAFQKFPWLMEPSLVTLFKIILIIIWNY